MFFTRQASFVVALGFFLFQFASCTTARPLQKNNSFRFVGEFRIPLRTQFRGTTVGGLSGLDYDSARRLFYLISDDGSKINPARYYTVSIEFNEAGIDTVILRDVITMKESGKAYDSAFTDPESIRYLASQDRLFWSSEGDRYQQNGKWVLRNPAIRIMSREGAVLDSFPLPDNLKMQAAESGPRNNGSLEGLAFSRDGKFLYVSVEEPLFEDGDRATSAHGATVRILKYEISSKKLLSQYAYDIDAVAYPPEPANAFQINGISEIFWLAKDRLIVMERSFSTGRSGCAVKLYLADLSKASDVSGVYSINRTTSVSKVLKKLLLDLGQLGRPIYNVEGICEGPRMANGHRTLFLVADDNFSTLDRTQFLMFEFAGEPDLF